MVQLVVGLVFVAGVLNLWGFLAKTLKLRKQLFIVVEVILVAAIIVATVFANKG